MPVPAWEIEAQIVEYAKSFLQINYGKKAVEKFEQYRVKALDCFDTGGVSEVCDKEIRIASRKDMQIGKLTSTTKLVVRHELGHILDGEAPDYVDFFEELKRERKAWEYAKPATAAEHWIKNLSIRTHIDPLKMLAKGFPIPEKKLSKKQLNKGTQFEIKRMRKDSLFVDKGLAERFAMVHLTENPAYYD